MGSQSINRAPGAANVNAAVTTAQIFPNLLNPTQAAILTLPAAAVVDRKVFLVRATGFATTAGATTTVAVSLYGVSALPSVATQLTPGSYTLIGTSTARVQNTTSAPWMIEAELLCDAISGKLHGAVNACVNNNYDNKLALSNVIASLNPGVGATVSDPFLYIVAALTFGVNASVANIAGMTDFVLDC